MKKKQNRRTNKTIQAAFLAGTLAVSGILAAAPAIPVLADVKYGTGSITIQAADANGDSETNSDVVYHGYQIFKANVADNTEGTTGKSESNIAWASDAVKDAVEKVLKEDQAYSGTTAQNAADYISEKIKSDTAAAVKDGTGTRAASGDFAMKLARAVAGAAAAQNVNAGAKTELSEGYWLFVTDSASTKGKTERTGTSPIFAVIGGSEVVVKEKTSIPTVDKQVQNDAKDAKMGHDAADSQMGQEISYELTGTVADNIASYDSYQYKFTDTLPKAMTPDVTEGEKATLHVYAVHEDGAGKESSKVELKRLSSDASLTDEEKKTGYTVTYDAKESVMTIDFADLKSVTQSTGDTAPVIDKDVKIVVDYQAKLDPQKAKDLVTGGSGNQNSVKITYSNNPHGEGTGESTPKTTTDYTYRLLLHKIDRTTEANLAKAKFTIQATAPDEGTKEGKTAGYVQADGTIGEKAYEFTTDENGELSVSGLDAGTYTVHETAAPAGYDTTADFTFEIKPGYTKETLTSLENILTATDSVIAGSTDGDKTDNVMKAKAKDNDAADTKDGTVKITVGDSKRVTLPLTGQSGIASGVAIGGFLVMISAAAMMKNRKKKAQD